MATATAIKNSMAQASEESALPLFTRQTLDSDFRLSLPPVPSLYLITSLTDDIEDPDTEGGITGQGCTIESAIYDYFEQCLELDAEYTHNSAEFRAYLDA